ncbi:MAG: alpha/beta fold hydrolase [Burkholderiales bacterium]
MARHIPGPLYFERQGATGRPMAFMHSTPDDLRFWMFQMAHFSAWFRCIAIDAAGYGRSPAAAEGVTMDDQASAHWEAIDRVTTDPVILHGNSMGSLTVRIMAVQRPERVSALILSGVGYSTNMREIQDRWKKRYTEEGIALRNFQVLDHFCDRMKKDPLVQHYASMVDELNNLSTLASIIAMNEALASFDMSDDYMARIKAPTLIITGTEDRSHAGVPELQKRIKGCEVRNMVGAGHANNFEKPWEYDQHVIEFLTKHGLYPA